MTQNYRQTDTDNSCGESGDTFHKKASIGGTAGGAHSISLASSGSAFYGFFLQVGSVTTIPSGNYVFRLNVTTANMNITWDQAGIHQLDSSCNFIATAQLDVTSISLGSTGVQTYTLTLASPLAINAGDQVYLFFDIKNGAMSAQSVGITFDQLIDTPDFSAGVAPSATDWYAQGRSVPVLSPPRGVARGILDLPVQFIVPATGTDAYGLFESVPPPTIGRGRARSFLELTAPAQAVAPSASDVYDLAAQRFSAWPRTGRSAQIYADAPYVGIGATDFYEPATVRFKPERQHPGRALANNVFMPYVGISTTDWFEPVRALQPRIGRGAVAELSSPQPYVGTSTVDFYEPGTIRFRAWTLTGRIAAALTLTAPPADYVEHARSKPQFAPQLGRVAASFEPFQPSATVAPSATDWYALAALYQPRPAPRGTVSFAYVALPLFVAPSALDWYTPATLRQRPAAPQLGRVASIEVNLPYVGINPRDWYEPAAIRARPAPFRGRSNTIDVQMPYVGIGANDWYEPGTIRARLTPVRGRVAAIDRITPLPPPDFAEFAALRSSVPAWSGRVASAYSDQAPVAYPNFYGTARFLPPDARQALKSFYSDQAPQQAAVVQDFSFLYGVAARPQAAPVLGVARSFFAPRIAFRSLGNRRGWEPAARAGFEPSADRSSSPGGRADYEPSGGQDYAPSGKRGTETS